MLYKILHVPGADRKMMTLFIDGFYNETRAVAELLGLKVVINEIECTKICRIQQYYKNSLSRIFDDFPLTDLAIILQEDLEASDDISTISAKRIHFLRKIQASIAFLHGMVKDINTQSRIHRFSIELKLCPA